MNKPPTFEIEYRQIENEVSEEKIRVVMNTIFVRAYENLMKLNDKNRQLLTTNDK